MYPPRLISRFSRIGLYATVGCHPTRSTEFEKHPEGAEAYLRALDALILANRTGRGRVVAVGECGLDYDRTHFASPDVQKRHFRECALERVCVASAGQT